MAIKKSSGTTPTERLLAGLCENTFLKLWSYPNPFKEDGTELCDLLAVFEGHLFVFFDRENRQLAGADKDPQVQWNRWKSKAVDAQVRTARGAEKYLRGGRAVFLDAKLQVPFPISINRKTSVIHKIVVAHGAEEACKESSSDNISGSLAVSYARAPSGASFPFFLEIPSDSPVHVLDGITLRILLSELDTIFDLSAYLDEKIRAIQSFDMLSYCGEEDLLAHYLGNYSEHDNRHFIGVPGEKFSALMIGEGEWREFTKREEYKRKKAADLESMLWDELIQKTCQNALDGTLLGDARLLEGKSAIHEMAREPRFMRRAISSHIRRLIREFPETTEAFARHVSLMPSFSSGKAYVFLQLKCDEALDAKVEVYRNVRRHMLEVACGAAKNAKPELNTIVGIAVYAPKFRRTNSEDFLLLDCGEWSAESRLHYEKENEELRFFATSARRDTRFQAMEFPPAPKLVPPTRVGRNDPCPCGSGKKYKRCCLK